MPIYILLWSFSHALERVVALLTVCVDQCVILKWHLNSQPLLLHPCCTKQRTVFHLRGKIICHVISTSTILSFGEKPTLRLTYTSELCCLLCQRALVLEPKDYSWHVQQSWIYSGSMEPQAVWGRVWCAIILYLNLSITWLISLLAMYPTSKFHVLCDQVCKISNSHYLNLQKESSPYIIVANLTDYYESLQREYSERIFCRRLL